jgi:hypothetical protein
LSEATALLAASSLSKSSNPILEDRREMMNILQCGGNLFFLHD